MPGKLSTPFTQGSLGGKSGGASKSGGKKPSGKMPSKMSSKGC